MGKLGTKIPGLETKEAWIEPNETMEGHQQPNGEQKADLSLAPKKQVKMIGNEEARAIPQVETRCKAGKKRLFRISLLLNLLLLVAVVLLVAFTLCKRHQIKEIKQNMDFAKEQLTKPNKDFMECIEKIKDKIIEEIHEPSSPKIHSPKDSKDKSP